MLEKINNAKDLEKLSYNDKNKLAEDIRKYIIEIVAKNGGHLASNLGVVDLTIAIHSVFDLYKDKLIWDVGHQVYTHKILTGRKKEMATLRKLDGISGFPKVNECKADCFNTGHSSTSISVALGMARARDINKEKYCVMALIGDGALTGGMALEGLNDAGFSKTKITVILNDNEMSISKNIGGLNMFLSKLRTKRTYDKSSDKAKKIILKMPILGKGVVKVVRRLKRSIKQLVIPKMFFEDIGFRYLGPVDGHNIKELERMLKITKELDGPVLLHVITKKGKGYEIAEKEPDRFHGASPFDIKTGKNIKEKSKDYSKVFGDKLVTLAEKNKKIVAITAAMKDGTGLTEFAKKYPNRFFDVGIAEQHAIAMAAGMAKQGIIPFITLYSSFYQRAYDQVIHDIAVQKLPVIMCVDRAGIVGADGETHQGLLDMSFFRLIPNLTILAPKNFEELEKMMEFAIELRKPIVIRYPRGGEEDIQYSKCKDIVYGKAEILRKGNKITVIAIGKMNQKAIKFSDLFNKGTIEVINTRFLKPLDKTTIIESIKKTKNVITIEDGTCINGLATAIKELIIDANIKDVKINCIAYPDEFIEHGSVEELEKRYMIEIDKKEYVDAKGSLKGI